MVLVALFLAPGAAPTARSSAAAATRASDLSVVVVLDVSGSMRRRDAAGRPLLDGARAALSELLATLPARARIGLRVYGSEYGGRNRRRSCRDTRLLVPVVDVDRRRVLREVRRLRPTGDTPIGLALRRAAGDLETAGADRGVVVLISDGEDNCSPPAAEPCEVAQALRRSGVGLRVETIGVALGGRPRARRALECISRRTGGDYYDARGADALSAALERISQESLGGLGPGRRVRGGEGFSRAPLIRPGTYRTGLRPGRAQWFRFRVGEGDKPRLRSTVRGLPSLRVPRAARSCQAWRAELYNPYGEGGTYPPYGNSGIFSGAGLGTAGASAASPVEQFPSGIDYAGVWRVRLLLERGPVGSCSAHLPDEHRFQVRFSLSLDGGRAVVDAAPPASSRAQVTEDGSVAAKYETRVREGAPAWVYPVVAVVAVVVCGLVLLAARLMLRRRRQGW